jgi:ribosome-binding ATPase
VHLGTAKVPDERIDTLSRLFKPKKTTYAEIVFSDMPGEHGAESKGLSAKALDRIREQHVLCLVLRDFSNPALDRPADPVADLEAFLTECLLADLGIVERRIDRAKKEKADPMEIGALEMMKATLEQERPIRSLSPQVLNRERLKGYALLTDRPLLVALNRSEEDAAKPLPDSMTQTLEGQQVAGMVLSASIEAEIATMDKADQAAFLAGYGLSESALARFIRAAYELLDLISFFTVGEDEVRAWPIRRGTHAGQAAGRIHSDLERGFIRAEVTPYAQFLRSGSEHAVRDAGHGKLEGKEYVVADGDVLNIRFSV